MPYDRSEGGRYDHYRHSPLASPLTDGWDWKTIIRQWLSDVPETFEPYDGLAEWLRDADSERIDCWHCLSWLANRRRSAVEFLSDEEKKRLASRLGFERIAGQER